VHELALRLPLPSAAKSTNLVGVIGVPSSMSVTVAVHVVVCPTAAGLGEQPTLVDVMRGDTDTEKLSALSPWAKSPP
jgi:hypothetical protein